MQISDIIEVDVRKDILEDGIDDVSHLEQVVHTFRCLPLDDGFLRTWVASINLLVLLEGVLLQLLRFQVVEGEGNLFILVILVIIVLVEVGLLLGSDHTSH